MRRRDIRTFLVASILICLVLAALWFSSFALKTEPGDAPADGDRTGSLSALPHLSAVVGARTRRPSDFAPQAGGPPPAAETAPPADPEPRYSWYTVRAGDTFERLAKYFYGSGALHSRIHEANRRRFPDPKRLQVGARLLVPAATGPIVTAEQALAREQDRTESRRTAPVIGAGNRPVEYVVRKGDTLYGIAERVYGTSAAWKRLHAFNRNLIDDPDRIKPGTRLYIPRLDPSPHTNAPRPQTPRAP